MAVIETWYNQDLQQPVQVHYLDGSMFSHNGKGNRIGVHVFNNGEAVTLSGTVSGYVVTSDGSTVPCTGSRSGNSASILIPAAAYQPGSVFITLFITDGTTVTTLASVAASVLTARTDNQIDPGSVVTDWTNTINAAMQAVVDANTANMATAYESITYPVPLGAYTIHDKLLYRCISPITSAEAWTASHWVRVKIADDVADLKSALNQKASQEQVDDLKSALNTTNNVINEIGKNGLYLSEITLTESSFESGAWSTSGTYSAASYRVRTKQSYHLFTGQKVSLSIKNGYKAVVRAFSSKPDGATSKTQVGTTDWQTVSSVTYTANQKCWVVVTIGNVSDTSISVETATDNVSVILPEYVKTHSEIRLDGVDNEIEEINNAMQDVPALELKYQNMFDMNTMVVGNNKAYDKTGTIEGKEVNLIDLNNYSAIKIPLHGETSVSVKQTGSHYMQLWGWYAVDENMIITSAYGSRISQYIQNGFTMSGIPKTAKYLCLSIAYYKDAIDAGEYLMVVQGSTPTDYEPYVAPWYQINGLKSDVLPEKQREIDANTAHRQWIGKVWAQYGDSISTYADMPNAVDKGWATIPNRYQGFAGSYMRGIGGQSFAYNAHGGSIAFINADGSLHSVNQSSNYDDYTGTVPSGTTKSRGAFCSWLRITLMFPATIKDDIDLVFVMGGTNDATDSTPPTWVENSTVDMEWAQSDYYLNFNGDYNIDTLQGGIASTIMKIHAWMPNALIVIGTPLNGRTGVSGGISPGTIPSEYQKSNQIIEAARMFGADIIDVFGGCGINVVNSNEYISDGVHPNSSGRIRLGAFIAGELNRIYPQN